MSIQPIWKCITRLVDTKSVYYILKDETGVYPEEGELMFPNLDKKREWKWDNTEVRRFILERCTFKDGILSDNQFHPEVPAWFATPEKDRVERPQDRY